MREGGTTTDGRFTPAVLALALTLVAGVALRFVTGSPLWLDEALSVHIADGPMALGDALRRDGHPALYYLLLGGWTDLAGDGDVAVRALSGLFAVATLPVLWAIARRRDRATAACTLALAASSPYLVRYATEARMYALVVLLVTVGWLALERAWERPTLPRFGAVAACTAALMHTHYWSFYAVAAAAIIVAYAGWTEERRTTAIGLLAAIAAGASTFLIWLPVFFAQLRDTGTPWADRARPTEVFIETLQGLGGNNRFEGETLGVLLAFAAAIGVFAVGAARNGTLELRSEVAPPSRLPTAAAALGLGLGATAAMLTAGAFEARYAAIALPFLLVLAGRGVAVLAPGSRAVVIILVVALGFAITVDEARRTRSQGEEVAAAIDLRAGPDDVIVFCPDQLGPATTHYLDTPAQRQAFPSGDGATVDWRNYLDRAAAVNPVEFAERASANAGAGAVWFVSGLGYRGLDAPCAAVRAHLTSLRPGTEVVGLSDVFEGMYAIRFDAP